VLDAIARNLEISADALYEHGARPRREEPRTTTSPRSWRRSGRTRG